jgi:hypothetical protein
MFVQQRERERNKKSRIPSVASLFNNRILYESELVTSLFSIREFEISGGFFLAHRLCNQRSR